MLEDILCEFGGLYVVAVVLALALSVVGIVLGWPATTFAFVGISIPGWVPVGLFGAVGLLGVGAAVLRVAT